MRRLIALLTVISCLSVANAKAEDKVLVVATEDYPPYEMLEPVDGLRGFDYEVMYAIFGKLGYQLDVNFLPWKRAIRDTKEGLVVGILTCAYLKEREEFIIFSDPISYFTSGFHIRKGFDTSSINKLEDVVGQSVAAIQGYESQKVLEKLNAEPMAVPNVGSGIRMLLAGRFDYLYLGLESTAFNMKQMELADKFDFHPLNRKTFHFCFSRAYEGNEALVKAFNRELAELRESGKYDQIHDKYR